MKNPPLKQALLISALAASAHLAQGVPVENTKWIQNPDLEFGMNVKATAPKILADDFLCTFTGPITDVHIWGSWLNDLQDPNTRFKLSIHKDIPKGPNTPYSRPGEQLWSMVFDPSQYIGNPWATTPQEPFFDPNVNQIIGFDNIVWKYDFYIAEPLAFVQHEGNIYWLDVQALTVNPTAEHLFGWKTSRDHWNDDAVWSDVDFGGVPTFWNELIDPRTGQSLDLAFALTTVPEPGLCSLLGFATAILLIMRRRR